MWREVSSGSKVCIPTLKLHMVGEGDLFPSLRTTLALQTPLAHHTFKEVLELPSRLQNYPVVIWKLPVATGHVN